MADLSGEYVLDGERTRIGFVAAHRVGGRVRGRFDAFEGAVRLDSADPAASDGWLSVRMESVDTGDRRRDAQLRKDFFGTAVHPAMTFVTTRIEPVSSGRYDVTGELTIRGTTRELTVPFELADSGDLADAGDDVRFTASVTIDRHAWNANWNAFTSALVRPDVVLDLDVTATRRV
jgi:polyisoprenoid-binding protein YceI